VEHVVDGMSSSTVHSIIIKLEEMLEMLEFGDLTSVLTSVSSREHDRTAKRMMCVKNLMGRRIDLSKK